MKKTSITTKMKLFICSTLSMSILTGCANIDFLQLFDQVLKAINLTLKLTSGETHKFRHALEQKVKVPFSFPGLLPSSMAIPSKLSDVPGLLGLAPISDPSELSMELGVNYSFAIKLVDDDGLATVKLNYDGITLTGGNGKENFNLSDSPLQALDGQSLTFKIDPLGIVKDITENDELVSSIAKEVGTLSIKQLPGFNAEKLIKEAMGSQGQKEFIESIFNVFPGKEVEKDDSWEINQKADFLNFGYMPIESQNKWSLTERGSGVTTLKLDGTLKANKDAKPVFEIGPIKIGFNAGGTQTGLMKIEESTGLPLLSETTQKMDVKVTLPEAIDALVKLAFPLPGDKPITLENSIKFEKRD